MTSMEGDGHVEVGSGFSVESETWRKSTSEVG